MAKLAAPWVQVAEDLSGLDKDAPLKEDIRLFGCPLGDVMRQQEGDPVPHVSTGVLVDEDFGAELVRERDSALELRKRRRSDGVVAEAVADRLAPSAAVLRSCPVRRLQRSWTAAPSSGSCACCWCAMVSNAKAECA